MAFVPAPCLVTGGARLAASSSSQRRLPTAPRAKSDLVNTPRRARAARAASDLRLLPSGQFPRAAPQQKQWDALLAAALVDAPPDAAWFRAPPDAAWFRTDAPHRVLRNPRRGKRGAETLPAVQSVKPIRKPHGFWNDLANVERELLLVNGQLGCTGKKSVPRLSEIAALGRGDLVAAISKHGGVKRVAEDLRWGRGGKTRRATSTVTLPDGVSGRRVRDKMLRRPKAYWDDIGRVQSEIGAFVAEYGVKGVMPTQKQFYAFERADLVQAAGRHGGLRVLSQSMGLRCRRVARKRLYWKDFEVLKKALLEFSEQHCPGYMPTGDELMSKGCSAITNAIAAHGGFPAVAEKLGLRARNTKAQGAPKTWDEQRLKLQLHAFTLTYCPDLARSQTIPTERQLRKHGRNDLSYAINKFGGYAAVAKALGLQQKQRGVFRSNVPISSDSESSAKAETAQ